MEATTAADELVGVEGVELELEGVFDNAVGEQEVVESDLELGLLLRLIAVHINIYPPYPYDTLITLFASIHHLIITSPGHAQS